MCSAVRRANLDSVGKASEANKVSNLNCLFTVSVDY